MPKKSQKDITQRVKLDIIKWQLTKKGDKVAVALSGGSDSVCLLLILLELQKSFGFELSACHYNHRLRGDQSDQDEKFVKDLCNKYGVDCFLGQAPKENIYRSEDSARIARYNYFEKLLEEGRANVVALAHNQNDLAETLLQRLIRGTGISGIRSIPLRRKNFIRPLLNIEKTDIISFLEDRNQFYRQDVSNLDTKFQRNFVRHRVLPLLKEKNPNIIETLSVTAKQAEEDYDFLLQQAKEAYLKILDSRDSGKIVLSHKGWQKLHPAMKKLVLRYAISELKTLVDITSKQLAEVVTMLNSGVGKKKKILPYKLQTLLQDGKITILKNNI